MEIAGAEKNLKVLMQLKGFNAVLIQLERLVVDGADKISSGVCDGTEDGAGFRELLGLREHVRDKLFVRKRALAIEEGAIEIFVERGVAGVEGGEGEIMAVLEFFPIQIKFGDGTTPSVAIPAVSEDYSADIPK